MAPEEAAHFSCNAVVLERDIVLPEGAPKLVHDIAGSRLQLPPVADDGISEGRRRLQMSDHVYAAADHAERPWSDGVME